MIGSKELKQAVPQIVRRSERNTPEGNLQDIFVDNGILAQVSNKNNQIIYGRRGTGKTHLLKVLASDIQATGHIGCYIDTRTLGSSSQFGDSSLSLNLRCTSLFRDILQVLQNTLLGNVMELDDSNGRKALDALSELEKQANEYLVEKKPVKVTTTETGNSELGSDLGLNSKKIGISVAGSKAAGTSVVTEEQFVTHDKIVFPELNKNLSTILTTLNKELYLLVDEWASIPQDIQPYLAEFLKRGFAPNPMVTIKIGSLEYRSKFFVSHEGTDIGLQLGGDIVSTVDLDDYYVFDKAPDLVTDSFSEILLNHLNSLLPEGYLAKEIGIRNKKDFPSKFFTQRDVFQELVRAAEGVARDLISIFSASYTEALRRELRTIDKRSVVEAARQWYQRDKSSNLNDQHNLVLHRIISEVIGQKKARSFLLKKELEKHPLIQQLFDLRVIHLVHRGYADKDNPGVRYNIYTLDYGTYVDLINTAKSPEIEMILVEERESTHQNDFVVPFDDKRSIRRIILDEKILN